MSLDVLKSKSLAQQYANLISSSQFMDAVKSASKNDKTGKYTNLLKNLENLSSSIEKNNSDSNVTETESGESLSLLKSIDTTMPSSNTNETNSGAANIDEAMRKAIDELIAQAELMEAMLDLEVSPSEDINDLLSKFRDIISKLDEETRKIHDDVKKKKTKEEFKLTPSSDTKSGFNESITLVAK